MLRVVEQAVVDDDVFVRVALLFPHFLVLAVLVLVHHHTARGADRLGMSRLHGVAPRRAREVPSMHRGAVPQDHRRRVLVAAVIEEGEGEA